jgi:hypothetical protein
MTPVRSTLLALSLSTALLGFGCGDSAPAEDAAAPAADEAAAPADEAAPAADEAAAPAADGAMAAAKMIGNWGVSIPAEDAAKLAEARKTLETNPEDAGAKMMVGMMDAMLSQMSLEVTAENLVMKMSENLTTIPYKVASDSADGCTLTTTEPDGSNTEVKVDFKDGVMVWTKAGEKAPMQWVRK